MESMKRKPLPSQSCRVTAGCPKNVLKTGPVCGCIPVLWFALTVFALGLAGQTRVYALPTAVTITSPVNGAVISGACVQVIADATAESNATITTITYRINGILIPPLLTNPLIGSLDTRNFANGIYALTATAADTAGGGTLTSAPVFVFIDNVAVLSCNATSGVVNVVFDTDISANDPFQTRFRPEFYVLTSPINGRRIRIGQVTHRFDPNIPNTKNGLGGSVVTLSNLSPALAEGDSFQIRILSEFDFDVPPNGVDACGNFGPVEADELFAGGTMSNIDNVCSGTVITSRPTVVNCQAVDRETIRVIFSKNVKTGGGGNAGDFLGNYGLESPFGFTLTAQKVEHDPAETGGTTTFLVEQIRPLLIEGNTFRVTVQNVQDNFGNVIEDNGSSNVCSSLVPDFTPPKVTACSATNTTLTVTFSEALRNVFGDPARPDNKDNYLVESPIGTSIDLTNRSVTAVYDDLTHTVTFFNLALTSGHQIRVEVHNVTDLQGNSIDLNQDFDNQDCESVVTDDIPPKIVTCSATTSSSIATAKIRIVYSEAVNQTDVLNRANYQLNGAPLPETASLIWDPSTNTVTIEGVTLVQGGTITIVVSGIRDLEGNVIRSGGPDDRCTTVVQDATAPTVIACVVTKNSIRVTFSEGVKGGDGPNSVTNCANYTLVGGPAGLDLCRATFSYNPGTFTVTIALPPPVTLEEDSSFIITVRNIMDLAGNRIIQDGVSNTCSGNVEDASAPFIDFCEVRQKQILINFSESVLEADAENSSNFTLIVYLKNDGIETGVGTLVSLDQATFTYTATLDPVTLDLVYNLIISGLNLPGNVRTELTILNVRDQSNVAISNNGVTNVCQGVVKTPFVSECRVDQSSFTVFYSEDVLVSDATRLSNYKFESPLGTPVDLTGKDVAYDAKTHAVTISEFVLTPGDSYRITVSNVHDLFGGEIVTDLSENQNRCEGTVLDSIKPQVISCSVTTNQFKLFFSKAMDPVTIMDLANYRVEQPLGTPKNLSGAAISYADNDTDGDTIPDEHVTTLTGVVFQPVVAASVSVTVSVTDTQENTIDPSANVAVCTTEDKDSIDIVGGTIGGVDAIDLVTFPVKIKDDDPINLFQATPFKMARWLPSQSGYQFYPDPRVRSFIGEGYWVRLNGTTTIPLRGFPTRLDKTKEVFLPGNNWFILGNPYVLPTTWDVNSIKVRFGGKENSLASLVGNVSRPAEIYAWGWDADAQEYVLVSDPALIPNVRSQLDVGRGAFYRTYNSGATFIFPSPIAGLGRTRSTRGPGASSVPRKVNDRFWSVSLDASAGNLKDTNNLLGVNADLPSADGLQLAAPPFAPNRNRFVELSFLKTGNTRSGAEEEFEVDLRRSLGVRDSWHFKVASNLSDAEITVKWNSLARLPKRYRARLVDELTGTVRAMRTTSFYTFRTNATGLTDRRFRLEVYPASEGGLQVSNVQVLGSRERSLSANISYLLNKQANVQVRILTLNGRVVRTLSRSSSRPGINVTLWDYRSNEGAILPSGLYFIEIIAEDEEGQNFRAIKTIRVR